MKAMILAAGAGSRLSPLTDNTPKALVPFQGKPLLEIILKRLKYGGFNDVVINVHHFADQIVDYLNSSTFPDMNIELSHEKELLDTGGGIKNAAHLLGDEPVLFHNVDILTEIDLQDFYKSHQTIHSQISLAIKDRDTTRNLLFNNKGILGGWAYPDNNLSIITRNTKNGYRFTAFSGIYIINPELFKSFPDEEVFSIMPWIIEQSKTVSIEAYDQAEDKWFDLGRTKNFQRAESKLILSEDGSPSININKG